MASALLRERLRHDLGLQLFLDEHRSQPPVLLLQVLLLENHQGLHAAELVAPFAESRGADTQLLAKIGH